MAAELNQLLRLADLQTCIGPAVCPVHSVILSDGMGVASNEKQIVSTKHLKHTLGDLRAAYWLLGLRGRLAGLQQPGRMDAVALGMTRSACSARLAHGVGSLGGAAALLTRGLGCVARCVHLVLLLGLRLL